MARRASGGKGAIRRTVNSANVEAYAATEEPAGMFSRSVCVRRAALRARYKSHDVKRDPT